MPTNCIGTLLTVGVAASNGAEGLGDRLIEFREQVAIAIQRHVDRRMTHSRLDCLRMRASGDGERDTRVPKVVETT